MSVLQPMRASHGFGHKFLCRLLAIYCCALLGVLSPFTQAATITFQGKVTDPAGTPLSGANVLVNRISGAKMQSDIGSLKTTTDASGNYTLPVPLEAVSDRVTYELWFTHRGYVRATPQVTFDSKQTITRTLDVKLPPGEILSGVFRLGVPNRSATGTNPPRPAPPYLFSAKGQSYNGIFMTEPNGSFEIYVPPGEYELASLDSPPAIRASGIKSGTTNLLLEPKAFAWSEATVGKVFDDFWLVMDTQYSYFFLKTNVNWADLKTQHRPKALSAKNAEELAKVLQTMLTPLADMHIWIDTPTGRIGTHSSNYDYNGNRDVTLGVLTSVVKCGNFALVGQTKAEGFGYFLMARQSNANAELVQQAVTAIQALKEAPGFIIDLRLANGGSEPLAQEIAKLFCATNTVYARHKYRNGPGHNDFSLPNERVLSASPTPFTKPVVCLIGPGAVSSGEGMVKMFAALPQVTTIGRPTRGASGNPKPYMLAETGVTVTFSRWVDFMLDGQTVEGRGIQPDIAVEAPMTAYAQQDPTLEKGLEVLRQKVATPSSF